MSFIEKINSLHLDVLKEIGNIGAAHAATALSRILNQKIEMSVPNVRIVSFNQMMELAGGPENVVASVFLRLEGDVTGSMFFILSLPAATYFIQRMIANDSFVFESESPHSEMSLSCLQELGNILSGSYLSSLSDFTNLHLYPSVPSLTIDMVGATISFGLLELSQVSDYAIVIDTVLEKEGDESGAMNGHFFLLPNPDSFEVIFNSLGVATDG
ncbi:chemotaxis protein CheC [Peribacillus asahii]|uniref:Chemotaxis protein CheY n=1 Tax=Peribacillus asahii TaxID=228899 RepID=A0A3Q9RML9_9BACI|nr:chemotaxis protein CheC [Peribacillus asahii]AZV42296.1 chemotaxis protein CheY [Peribacillus asahii]USK86603.1 chemotaxis protein CheC [Peribacillus asahii]